MAASAAPSLVGSRIRIHQPLATAPFGVPAPISKAHEQPEIVPGDVDQIALVDILPAPQPRPVQTTPVQDVRKGALDQFGPQGASPADPPLSAAARGCCKPPGARPRPRANARRPGAAVRQSGSSHAPPSRSFKTARE